MTHPTMPVSMPRYVGVGSPGDARLNRGLQVGCPLLRANRQWFSSST